MAFHVGQRVVCVSDKLGGSWDAILPGIAVGGLDGLRRGSIYTVASVEYVYSLEVLVLAEINRKQVKKKSHINARGFASSRFRPVVERKTDISIFEALLNPANHKQLERAP
jgi:hypothetical protein